MTTISIIPEPGTPPSAEMKYRAIAGRHQSVGKTPGEALDAISAQLDEQEAGTLLVVQQMRPDRFFGEAQIKRLGELMDRMRAARDQGAALPAAEQSELESLIDAEVEAATQRASAMLGGKQP